MDLNMSEWMCEAAGVKIYGIKWQYCRKVLFHFHILYIWIGKTYANNIVWETYWKLCHMVFAFQHEKMFTFH